MTFYIFFTKRDAFISNCIAKATGSKVSHTGIIAGDMVYEARGDGKYRSVISQKFSEMLKDPDLTGVWVKKIEVDNEKQALKWLKSRVGWKYDFINTVVIQPVKIVTGWLIGQKKDEIADNRYMCGEYSADFLKYNWIEKQRITEPIASYAPNILFDLIEPWEYKFK